jgi:hypothetical protein
MAERLLRKDVQKAGMDYCDNVSSSDTCGVSSENLSNLQFHNL